jgi:hypothetical protein
MSGNIFAACHTASPAGWLPQYANRYSVSKSRQNPLNLSGPGFGAFPSHACIDFNTAVAPKISLLNTKLLIYNN